MFLSNVDLLRFSECFSFPKQVLRIKQDQRGGRSGVSEEPPLPKYLSHFHPPDHFFWQLTKQTWSALTETLLIKTVLVLRMVVVLVFSSCDRDPLPGQCPGTTWEAATYPPLGRAIRSPQVFNHVEVVIRISREDVKRRSFKTSQTQPDLSWPKEFAVSS